MNLRRAVLLAAGGYVIGSVSFARLVGRRVTSGTDLTRSPLVLPGGATVDYRGVSATSVAVHGGPAWGLVTGLLDMAKAFVPTLIAKRRWPNEPDHLVVAVGTVVGHNYPLYHGFAGGRGQTPMYGSLLAIDWPAIPATTAVGSFIGVVILRDLFVGYTLGMWLLIPWFLWRRRPAAATDAVAVNALYTAATIPETKRYFELRRAGEIERVPSLCELLTAHPAMRRASDEPRVR